MTKKTNTTPSWEKTVDGLDRTTAHEYANTIRYYLALLTSDEKRIEEITGTLINRSYDHFYQFFKRNRERIVPTPQANIIKAIDGKVE